jgi:poly-gamma-glutamate capsule biosynthesis protein CapA/YwtB (metallophosphatase superfamily)
LKILVAGDFCPHNRIEKLVMQENNKLIFNDLLDVLSGNELNIVDLECPLTLSDQARKKTGPHQKAHPQCVGLLKLAGFNLATLANNHLLDYGAAGAAETVEVCQKAGIQVVGVGTNLKEARKPFLASLQNKKVAILNISENEFLAAKDGEFCANALNVFENYKDIVEARKNNDLVLVIMHGGHEFYPLPSPRTKSLYRFFIEAGADAVLAHHAHCYSGFEYYQDKPIFYGLGNFLYDWPEKVNTPWNYGYVVKLIITDSIHHEIVPFKQCNGVPAISRLNENEQAEFWLELDKLNAVISNDDDLESSFERFIQTVSPMYDSFLEPNFGRLFNALRQKGLLPDLMSTRKRRLLLNLFRCETHRDALLQFLKKYE